MEAVDSYDPPNLTFPFGSYICVVDIDRGTGEVKVRRFLAIDDCGNIINPMIVDGQIHGGLSRGRRLGVGDESAYTMRMKAQTLSAGHVPHDPRATKKPTNVTVNSDLLQKARELGINLSATLEEALAAKVRARQQEIWLEENQEAIAAYNEYVAKNGVFSDGARSF